MAATIVHRAVLVDAKRAPVPAEAKAGLVGFGAGSGRSSIET